MKSAQPGTPAEVLGLRGVPMAGDERTVVQRHALPTTSACTQRPPCVPGLSS